MPFTKRFSTIARGGIRFIGNTLGLSKIQNLLSAGTRGSIGAFTSLKNVQVPTFPLGTTLNYLDNGSSAILTLQPGSDILYAELVWGGLYKSLTQNIVAVIDSPVRLSNGVNTYQVTPDNATKQNFLINTGTAELGFYVRSAVVTNVVKETVNGVFSVEQVPAILEAIDNNTSETCHAGWTLMVVYQNATENLRNLTVWAGGAVVGVNTTVTDIAINGFLTPVSGASASKIFISAQEGDAAIGGDQLLFGKDIPSLTPLSGVNNVINNFFGSQINNENGVLDTTGTFGTRNQSPQTLTNRVAGRQGWDITAVGITNLLPPSTSSAVARLTSSGDLYVANGLAIQIDSSGAQLKLTKSSDVAYQIVNRTIKYTINVTNEGVLSADNIVIHDSIPTGLSFVNDSVTIDGVAQPGVIFPISLPSIAPGKSVIVEYSLLVDTFPLINPAVNTADAEYTFTPFSGVNEKATAKSNSVSVLIIDNDITLVKSVDKAIAIKGDKIKYSTLIVNNGVYPIKDIIFTDTLPVGTKFVVGSLTVDGASLSSADPSLGVNVGSLAVKEFRQIEFYAEIE